MQVMLPEAVAIVAAPTDPTRHVFSCLKLQQLTYSGESFTLLLFLIACGDATWLE